MCDYSLMSIRNRLAEKGENLVVHRFPTGSLGFASPLDLREAEDSVRNRPRPGFWLRLWRNLASLREGSAVPAVCIPPGSRLLLQDIPEALRQKLRVGPIEVVAFTELTAEPNRYRDAIQFQNGRHVLLQNLNEGQRGRVLDLSSTDADEPHRKWLEAEVPGRR
jgi:hypothetical protein